MKRTLLAAIVFTNLLQAQPQAEKLFEQALMKERSQGDLKAAIDLYQRIANDSKTPRPLAAKALLEMARCQEKHGAESARRTYERLVKDFADQPAAVSSARARMAALALAVSKGPRIRQLWAEGNEEGSISSDGRWLTFAHWDTGDLGLRDLHTNSTKLLTNTGGWGKSDGVFAQDSRFSPDAKRIAYNWFIRQPDRQGGYELRLMNADGSGVRTIGWPGGDGYVVPLAWSPDGATVATAFYASDGRVSLFLVSVVSGEKKELIPPGQFRQTQRASFSPDGKWLALSGPSQGSSDIFIIPVSGGSLVPITTHTASDSTPHWSADGRAILFLSNRSGSYGLWQVPIADGKVSGPASLIRDDLGQRVSGVGFTASGSFAFARITGGSDIFSSTLDPATGLPTGQPELISSRRPGGHVLPVLSPDGKRLLYQSNVPEEVRTSATIRDIATGTERTVPLPSRLGLTVSWAPDSERLLLESVQPSNKKELHWFDPSSGKTTPFVTLEPTRNPISPTFSKDGKTLFFLFREWPEEAVAIMAMDVATKERRTLYKAAYKDGGKLRGLALSKDGSQLASFRLLAGDEERELIVIPITGGMPRAVARYRGTDSFVNRPAFSLDGQALIVWQGRGIAEKGAGQLLRIDLATGARQLIGIDKKAIAFPSVDPSGSKIYFQAGTNETEIWIAENILPVAH